MSWPVFRGVSSVCEEIQEEGITLGGWRLGDGREGSSANSKLRLREAKQIDQIKQLIPDSFVTQCRNGQRSIIKQKDICIGSSLYLLSTLATDKPWLGHEPADIGAELMGPHSPDPGVTCKAGNWIPCVISQSPYPKTEAPAYAADHVWPAHWPAHTPTALQRHSETLLSNNTEKFMMFDFEGPTLFLPTLYTSSPYRLDTGFLVGGKTFPLSTQSSTS